MSLRNSNSMLLGCKDAAARFDAPTSIHAWDRLHYVLSLEKLK